MCIRDRGKPVRGSKVLVLGVAYKKDIDDVRESPALDIVELLSLKGAAVSYHDPHVPSFRHNGHALTSVTDLALALETADCVVIATDHSMYDWADVTRRAALVIDTRHALP